MSDTLESQAKELGIPMQIEITDGVRYHYCDAHMANLVAIEDNGKYARYQGECANGHNYQVRRRVQELQQQISIMSGGLTLGSGKGYSAEDNELQSF